MDGCGRRAELRYHPVRAAHLTCVEVSMPTKITLFLVVLGAVSAFGCLETAPDPDDPDDGAERVGAAAGPWYVGPPKHERVCEARVMCTARRAP